MALCGANGTALKKVYEESRDKGIVTTPSKLEKGLPRQTESLCPECVKIIPATIYSDKGALMMKKDCEEHGHFEDVLWSDVELYLKAERWAFDGVGIENPQVTSATTCPTDCGLCNLHYDWPWSLLLHYVRTGERRFFDRPGVYVDPASGEPYPDSSERFLFFDPTRPKKNYNYSANSVLCEAIEKGARGAYWDILTGSPLCDAPLF
jgi:hypothetical protein